MIIIFIGILNCQVLKKIKKINKNKIKKLVNFSFKIDRKRKRKNMNIYNDNKLVFVEEHCMWITIEESNYIIELEKFNFEKTIRKLLKYILPLLWITFFLA